MSSKERAFWPEAFRGAGGSPYRGHVRVFRGCPIIGRERGGLPVQRIPVSADDAFHLLVRALLLLDVPDNRILRIECVQRKFERGVSTLRRGNGEVRVINKNFRVNASLGQIDFVVFDKLRHIDGAREEGCRGDKALLQHRNP